MDDLLQKQIRDSCKLALPSGLQDLMSDISREVLRAQPQNLLQFITDYLSTLLAARKNLFIASKVCDDVCKARCHPELEDELREIGLSDEDVGITVEVVTDFFESGGVKETNLLIKLLKKTEIDETQLPAVLEAVRRAFRSHQANNAAIYESSSTDDDFDEPLTAVKNTLKIYKKKKKANENNDDAVKKIQTAYQAYDVRRQLQLPTHNKPATTVQKADAGTKALHFNALKIEQLFPEIPRNKRCSSKASSISLAGSFVPLPAYKPYSIDVIYSDADEICEKEKEHISVDYTQHWKSAPEWNGLENKLKETKKKNISFHDLPQVFDKNSEEDTDEIPEEVEALAQAEDELEEVKEELQHETKEAEKNFFSDIINETLKKEEEHVFMPKDEQIYEEVTPLPTMEEYATEKLEKTKDNELEDEQAKIKEITAELQRGNFEIRSTESKEVIDEKLSCKAEQTEQTVVSTNDTELIVNNFKTEQNNEVIMEGSQNMLVATKNVAEEQVSDDGTGKGGNGKEYEAKRLNEEVTIEELINEPIITEMLDEELMWYDDGDDRTKENSIGQIRDDGDDRVTDYLENDSIPTSFIDLSY